LDWVVRQRKRHGRAALQTYVSQAVRFSQAARRRGIGLEDVQLLVGSEPITPARRAEIAASGAEVFVRYYSSEIGSIGIECLDPAAGGDMHLMHDMIALVQRGARDETGERPFLFTSLQDIMPKVMINVSLGDVGVAEQRDCGCPLGRLGFTTHLQGVRSARHVACEGMTVSVAELTRIIEEVVRPRHGGSTLDYQWVVHECPDGHSRLRLRVSPSVGPVDEAALISDVLAELARASRASRVAASVWRQAGTLEMVRQEPRRSASVKTPPLAGD
jgi:phenylacetate-coenzyme A ligase PaaK-like adenylate-forming protein